jgi:hypothetical protein
MDRQQAQASGKDGVVYIVVNIGCIECCVSSDIVGIFRDKARAEAIAKECRDKLPWREWGQNEYGVFQFDLQRDLDVNLYERQLQHPQQRPQDVAGRAWQQS